MEINTLLLIVIGVMLLWLAGSGRLDNIVPAWHVLIGQ